MLDSWPKTYTLYLGSNAYDKAEMHPFHLGTDLEIAKKIARERFEGYYKQKYKCASLWLGDEMKWSIE